MEYEDGEETKSDFLARMILMGRVDIDGENKYVNEMRMSQLHRYHQDSQVKHHLQRGRANLRSTTETDQSLL